MLFHNSCVLMLVYVDDKRMDIAGNEYPQKGYIKAKDFSYDTDIQKGLCGFLWGKARNIIYEDLKSKNWIVVKVERNKELICVDRHQNRYKFMTGKIVRNGDPWICSRYILQHKEDPDMIKAGHFIEEEDIVGTIHWNRKRRNETKQLSM